jgi:hypothetical protein
MSLREADNSQEEWRAIADYPGYEVSDQGNVRRSELLDPYGRRVYEQKLLATALSGTKRDKDGNYYTRYLDVSLRVGNDLRRHAKVHHLVAGAFIGPRPAGMVICHNNGDHHDNRVENLRYDSQHANILDMHDHRGGHPNTRKTHCKYGHDITDPDNIYPNGNGRKCKTCARAHAARQWEARKAAKDSA